MNAKLNEQQREIRRRPEVTLACPKCGKSVTLYAETHEWHVVNRGKPNERWDHSSYGPADGECCDLAFIDCFGEIRSFVVGVTS